MDFRVNVGKATEDEVQATVEAAFSPDFVFRSPRRQADKEVTDVLVLFDDVCLVIQVKAQAVAAGLDSPAQSDWAAKNLRKASRQVGGAVRALRAGRVRSVENSRRGRVPFDIRAFPYVYGLVVLDHESEPYDPYEVAPSLREIKAHVTVLSYRDFWNLSDKLNTPNDLINYLEHRPVVLVPTLSPKVHREAEVFGYYIDRLEDVMEARAVGEGRSIPPEGVSVYARELRRVVSGEHPDQDAGLIVDHIIDRIHDTDPELHVIESTEIGGRTTDQATYIIIATELARIPRIRRIALGVRFRRIARLAEETEQDCHQLTHSPTRSDCFVFVASPRGRDERQERAKYLLALTALAKNYCQVHRAIGVATEAGDQVGRSYDMVLLDGPPSTDETVQELGGELFGGAEGRLLAVSP